MRATLILLFLAAALQAQSGSAPNPTAPSPAKLEWRAKYFFDSARETLQFTDLAVPSPDRTVAVGNIFDEARRKVSRHVSLVTSDGGAHWTEERVPEAPQSVYFVNESVGWMVTDQGLWQSVESGHSWHRIYKHAGSIHRVWFLDAKHGFAIGNLALLESHDGGHHWKSVPLHYGADSPTEASFRLIAFTDGRNGMILGTTAHRDKKKRLTQSMRVMLRTDDGGAIWQVSASNSLENVSDIRVVGGNMLALMTTSKPNAAANYDVYRINFKTDLKNIDISPLLRVPNGLVTSVAVFGDHGFAVASKLPSASPRGPRRRGEPPYPFSVGPALSNMPVKLHILESGDLKEWSEMAVDYRAEGKSALLAGTDPAHLYLATDMGMILRFQ